MTASSGRGIPLLKPALILIVICLNEHLSPSPWVLIHVLLYLLAVGLL